MSKKVKLFLSQPMGGLTTVQIKAERERVKRQLEDWGLNAEIIDSFAEDTSGVNSPLWLLGQSLQKLSEADLAWFTDGWEQARGCIVEHECAVRYKIPIIRE